MFGGVFPSRVVKLQTLALAALVSGRVRDIEYWTVVIVVIRGMRGVLTHLHPPNLDLHWWADARPHFPRRDPAPMSSFAFSARVGYP